MRPTNQAITAILLASMMSITMLGCGGPPAIEPSLLDLATSGDAQAQFEVGEQYRKAYYSSFGLFGSSRQLWDDAASWYEMAATQGHADAQSWLATYYFTFQNDYDRSFHWEQRAAAQGLAEAQHSLGVHYAQGWGTSPDPVLAYKWMKLGFDGGVWDPIGKLTSLQLLVERAEMTPAQIAEGERLAAEHTANFGPSRSMRRPS